MTEDDCGAIDMTNSYNATDDVMFLARKTYERETRRAGGIAAWDLLPLVKQTEYLANAGWAIHMLIGLRGYKPEGMQ